MSRHEEFESEFDRLSPRERVVLGRLMEGESVADIAAAELLSTNTVREYVKGILAKLDVTSQHAAVAKAYRVGWRP